MEHGKARNAGGHRQARTVYPGRVPVAAIGRHLRLEIGAVVDHQIGAGDEIEQFRIENARLVLVIIDKGDGTAAPVDPVTDAAARMDEAHRADRNVLSGCKGFTRPEIDSVEACLTDAGANRKPRRPHEVVDHFRGGHLAVQMAGPEADRRAAAVDRLEIGQPDDVVVMGVGEEDVELGDTLGHQRQTGFAQS